MTRKLCLIAKNKSLSYPRTSILSKPKIHGYSGWSTHPLAHWSRRTPQYCWGSGHVVTHPFAHLKSFIQCVLLLAVTIFKALPNHKFSEAQTFATACTVPWDCILTVSLPERSNRKNILGRGKRHKSFCHARITDSQC